MSAEYLFTYGTLRSDFRADTGKFVNEYAVFLSRGTVRGKLYDLGGYPGLLVSDRPDDVVIGEIYEIKQPDLLFKELDEYEGCSSHFPEPKEYRREIVSAEFLSGKTIDAWTYLYNLRTTGTQLIQSGDYVEYIRAN